MVCSIVHVQTVLADDTSEKDGAVAAFNCIMTIEAFSLLNDERQTSLRDELSLYEIYKTRLLRVDLGTRTRPFQR
jgi:hypothetical protein